MTNGEGPGPLSPFAGYQPSSTQTNQTSIRQSEAKEIKETHDILLPQFTSQIQNIFFRGAEIKEAEIKEELKEKREEKREVKERKEEEKLKEEEKIREPDEIIERVAEVIDSYEGVREIVEKVRVLSSKGVKKEVIVSRVKEFVEVERRKSREIGKILEVIAKGERGEVEKEAVLKEISSVASKSKGGVGREIEKIIEEGKKEGVGKENIIEKIKESFSRSQRGVVGIVDECEKIVKEADVLSKGDILNRLNEILQKWKEEIKKLEKIVKEANELEKATAIEKERIREKKRREELLEEFFKKIKRLLEEAKEKELADELERKRRLEAMGTSACVDWLKEVLSDVASNPYLKKIERIVRDSSVLSKDEIVAILKKITAELVDIERIISGLTRIVSKANVKGMEKDEILNELRSLFLALSTDRFGRKLFKLIKKCEDKNLTKKEVIEEIKKILPQENNTLAVITVFNRIIEKRDFDELNRVMEDFQKFLGILEKTNHQVRKIKMNRRGIFEFGAGEENEKNEKIIKMKREMRREIFALYLKIKNMLEMESEKREKRFKEMIIKNMFDEYYLGKIEKEVFWKRISDLFLDGSDYIRNRISVYLNNLIKLKKISGFEKDILSIAERTVKIDEVERDGSAFFLKMQTLKMLRNLISLADLSKMNGEIEEKCVFVVSNILKNDRNGNRKLRIYCLETLKGIALRNSAAVDIIKTLSNDSDKKIALFAQKIINELGL